MCISVLQLVRNINIAVFVGIAVFVHLRCLNVITSNNCIRRYIHSCIYNNNSNNNNNNNNDTTNNSNSISSSGSSNFFLPVLYPQV